MIAFFKQKMNRKMKQWLSSFAIMLWLAAGLSAQNNQYTSAADSDPEAKAILDKLRKKYDAYQSLEAQFRLEIALPEQPAETQTGTLARDGDKYRMELANYGAISDGTAVWILMHNNKEVQINDMPEADAPTSILSPEAMLNFYDRGEYAYYLMTEMMENGKLIQQIEFKPLDRYSDYTKLRLTLDKRKTEVVRIKVFSKDGSNYTLWLDQLKPNKSFAGNYFTFDKSQYPDYYVEDLREN